MDREKARKIYESSIGEEINIRKIDYVISKLEDLEEKKIWIKRLGNVFRVIDEELLNPIEREHPEFREEYGQV